MSAETITQKNAGGFLNNAANIFSSVRLAVVLIAMVSLICAAGTFLPQMKPYSFYVERYGGFANLIFLFSLNDIYHSFIFYFAVAFLCLNIFVCTIRRLKGRVRALSYTGEASPEEHIGRLKYICSVEDFDARRLAAFEKKLKMAGYKLFTKTLEDGTAGYAESGRYFFAGEQLVHLSIIVIIAGAMIGNIFGYKTYARLYPGDTYKVPAARYQALRNELERLAIRSRETGSDSHVAAGELLKKLEAEGGREIFSLKVTDFTTEYFPSDSTNTGETHVKNWNTRFTLIDEGREMFSGVISVNSPLRYKGVDIYQSSYYKSQDRIKKLSLTAVYNQKSGPARSETLEFKNIGDEKIAEGGKFKFRLSSFVPDFRFDPESREIYSAGDAADNPAVKLVMTDSLTGGTKPVWLFKNIKGFADSALKESGCGFALDIESLEIAEREGSGLQINYDPGAGLVWFGCFLITCGLFMSFNISRKRIWYSFDASRKCITAGAITNKDGPDFAAGFARLFEFEDGSDK